MRTCVLIACSLVLLVFASGCASISKADSTTPPDHSLRSITAEVKAICGEMEQAMRDDDLIKVASFYADDAILLNANGEVKGGSRAALEAYWAGFGTGVDWSLITHSVEGVEGLVVQRGRSILTYISNGERRTGVVEFILLWQRQADGTLKIQVDGYWS